MPKGFDYDHALERADNPRPLTEEERRKLQEETVPTIQAAQIAEGSLEKDRETGQKLLRIVKIDRTNSVYVTDTPDFEEVEKIIDAGLEKRQDRR